MHYATLMALNGCPLTTSLFISSVSADTDLVSKGLWQVNTIALGISWLTSIFFQSIHLLQLLRSGRETRWYGHGYCWFPWNLQDRLTSESCWRIRPRFRQSISFSSLFHTPHMGFLRTPPSHILIISASFLSSSLHSKNRASALPSRNNGISDAISGIHSRLATNFQPCNHVAFTTEGLDHFAEIKWRYL